MLRNWFILSVLLSAFFTLRAQPPGNDAPQTYIIGGVEVEGAEFSSEAGILSLSGLEVDSEVTIPGLDIANAIKKLWKQNIFSDIEIRQDNISGNKIFLTIIVRERPRISSFSFEGVSKSQANDLREKINFIAGTILTESKQQSAKRIIRNFFVEKGFFSTSVEITSEPDPVLQNGVLVKIDIDRGKRVRIDEILVEGNTEFADKKVKRKLKKTKEKSFFRVWARSKYVPKEFEEAKKGLVSAYNDAGFRDAIIEFDTVFTDVSGDLKLRMKIFEGNKFYFRDINWVGNYKYNSEQLRKALGIAKGDVYSTSLIDRRLFGDPNGNDLSALYLDDGFLFFNIDPVEVLVEGDSIDLEMRIFEGPQATIRKIIIEGNTKTSDYVILRELRTVPGEKFRRSDLIRSQREILNLGFFDQEKINVTPIPDPASGTVDLKYTVEERPSDQLQLQGGWGGRVRDAQGNAISGGFVGTVQLLFNNFSSKRMFQKGAWRPVPAGDGQKLSLAFQMNGIGYQNISISFLEPWLGGKKPNSLGISTSYVVFRNIGQDYKNKILTTSLDYGRRLKFPDDFFRSFTSLGYRYYDVLNPQVIFPGFGDAPSAYINSLTLKQAYERSSIDAPIYPRSGSSMLFSVEATPPWSAFSNKDYRELPPQEKYNLLEYHKWQFKSDWYFSIVGNLVLRTRVEAGFLGSYHKDIGPPPLERFYLGGAGLQGFNAGLDGRDIIPLRGYENLSINNNQLGNVIYNKYALELRYPVTLNQSAPIWLLAFAEAGNGYDSFKNYNPLDTYRSAGAGVRVMLPMVGLLGLDWGYGFDAKNSFGGSQFHFILGQDF